jgi:uncharacterized protein YkwD
MILRYVSTITLAITLAVIAALGAAASVPQEAEAASVTVKTCTGGSFDLTTVEKRVLDLHNQARTKRGLKALCVHPALMKAARSHSQEMLDKDYTSHNSYNGETLKARLKRFGYTFSGYSYYRYGENIAWNYGSSSGPDNCFNWWMSSSGHRANILNKSFRDIGIGVRVGTFKSYSNTTMCTVDFGVRR